MVETLRFDHFILLHRRNVLRTIIFAILAESMGYYHRPATGPFQPLAEQDLRTTVNLKDVLMDTRRGTLLDTMERVEGNVAEARQALENRNSLTLVHENHVEREALVAAEARPGDLVLVMEARDPSPTDLGQAILVALGGWR